MRLEPDDTGNIYSQEAHDDPLGFYHKYYAGLTQKELLEKIPLLYLRLWREQQLREIPRKRKLFDGDAVAYYHRHYAGMTRGQLRDRDPGCYEHLRRKGLLGQIPLKPRTSFPDPLAYFREHCAGMTRKQVSMAEPQFYGYVQRHRLWTAIPFTPAVAAGHADRVSRQPEEPTDTAPERHAAKPAQPPRRRTPSLASARLECFRIIPE